MHFANLPSTVEQDSPLTLRFGIILLFAAFFSPFLFSFFGKLFGPKCHELVRWVLKLKKLSTHHLSPPLAPLVKLQWNLRTRRWKPLDVFCFLVSWCYSHGATTGNHALTTSNVATCYPPQAALKIHARNGTHFCCGNHHGCSSNNLNNQSRRSWISWQTHEPNWINKLQQNEPLKSGRKTNKTTNTFHNIPTSFISMKNLVNFWQLNPTCLTDLGPKSPSLHDFFCPTNGSGRFSAMKSVTVEIANQKITKMMIFARFWQWPLNFLRVSFVKLKKICTDHQTGTVSGTCRFISCCRFGTEIKSTAAPKDCKRS